MTEGNQVIEVIQSRVFFHAIGPANERTVRLPQGSCALTRWVTRGEKIGCTTLFLWQQGAMLGEADYNSQ